MSGEAELEKIAPQISLELTGEGEARFRAALAGLREFNPALTPAGLVAAIFLYGLDQVELELATARIARGEAGEGTEKTGGGIALPH
jgi:hypothetical protein